MKSQPESTYEARRAERQARLADLQARNDAVIEGRKPPAPRPLTDEERFALEFPFAARARQREKAAAEHWARRRKVEAEVAMQDRLYRTLRNSAGKDYADCLFAGGGYDNEYLRR
jgi:hypothetical protein